MHIATPYRNRQMHVPKLRDIKIQIPESLQKRIVSFLKSGKQLHSFPVQIQFKFLPFPFQGNVILYRHQLYTKTPHHPEYNSCHGGPFLRVMA